MRERWSGQEPSESGNDVVNQIRHILERFERRFDFDDPRCVERYVERKAAILCHGTIEGFDVEFVASMQHIRPIASRKHEELAAESDQVHVGPNSSGARDHIKTPGDSCADKELMLVGLVQLMQLPERVPLPALVRLGCIDCIYHLLPHGLYLSSRGLVIRGAPSDRIVHDPLRLRAAEGVDHELMGDVVERASEILDYVGGNSCKRVRHGISLADVVNAFAGLRIFLHQDFIGAGVIKGCESKLKILDVLFGPCNFGADLIDDRACQPPEP